MYDIIEARYIERYNVELLFENGEKGIANLEEYSKRGGVFQVFSDINYFKDFHVNQEIGTLCWSNGADISPEKLYQIAIKH